MTEQELQERAEANVGFYRHLLVYVLVNTGIMAFDYFDNNKIDWAFFPLLGWGLDYCRTMYKSVPFVSFPLKKKKNVYAGRIHRGLFIGTFFTPSRC